MQSPISLGLGALAAVALLSFLPRGAEPQPTDGHLVLVVEGDATALRVTHAVHKDTPCGRVPKGLTSEFSLAVLDSDGVELWRQPVDLSKFDTDPAHVGNPVRVTGDVVHDTRIALLVNVPDYTAATELRFRRGGQQIGSIGSEALKQLLGGGR